MNIQCIKVINEVPWYGTGAWGDEKLRLLIHGEDMKRRRGRKLRWPGWNAGVSRATRDQSHQLAGKHGDARPIAWLGRSVSEAACLRREHRLPDLCCHPPGWNHQRTYTLTLTVMHYFNSLSLSVCVCVSVSVSVSVPKVARRLHAMSFPDILPRCYVSQIDTISFNLYIICKLHATK